MVNERFLTEEQGQLLLQCARQALADYFSDGQKRPFLLIDPVFAQKAGAFVTLWIDETTRSNRHDMPEAHLRGCIGQVVAQMPLHQLVPQMAVRAATADPRFPPLTAVELPRVTIELSILSPLHPLSDPQNLQIGVHGLVIESHNRRGLLLPEVPISRGWNGEQFLQAVCRKAGLPKQAWQWPDVDLFVFTAQVFAEPIPVG